MQLNNELPPQPIEAKIIFMIQSDKVVGGESEEYQVTEWYWQMAIKEHHMTGEVHIEDNYLYQQPDGIYCQYKVLDHDAFIEHTTHLKAKASKKSHR